MSATARDIRTALATAGSRDAALAPLAMIEVVDVTKRFGATLALDHVSLSVGAGQVLALLGPNGAGKTTLVRVLTTLLRPDSGQARVAGLDVTAQGRAVRSMIGLAGQYASVDDLLTGRENLELAGLLCHLDKAVYRQPGPAGPGPDVAHGRGRPAGQDLLRRHAPPAGPRGQPDRPPAGAVPRRAHDRAGPPHPQRPVAARQRARGRGHDRAADHPVHGGSRAPGPTRSPSSTPAGSPPRAPPTSSRTGWAATCWRSA